MAKNHWHGALRSAHKSCTHSHMSLRRSNRKRGLVSADWTSCRWFSHVLWSKAHNHWRLRACLLSSSLRDMLFPSTVYTCNQGPLSSTWAHCLSCAPSAYSLCRRSAVAARPSVIDSTWESARTLQEVQARTTDHDLYLSCIWWTFTSNSSLHPSPTQLQTLAYIPWTRPLSTHLPSFLSAHQMTFLGTRHSVKCLLKVYKSHVEYLVGS